MFTTAIAQESVDLTKGTFSGEISEELNNPGKSFWTYENGLTIVAKDANGNEVAAMKYHNGFQLKIYSNAVTPTTPIEFTITVPEGYTLTSMKFENGFKNYDMTVNYGLRSYPLLTDGKTITKEEIIFTEDNHSFQLYGTVGRHIYITELVITKVGGDNEGEGEEGEVEGGENETSINEVKVENAQVIYDLTGRRVDEITEKGIYIINGKKVIK
jgi:hypothetical protein